MEAYRSITLTIILIISCAILHPIAGDCYKPYDQKHEEITCFDSWGKVRLPFKVTAEDNVGIMFESFDRDRRKDLIITIPVSYTGSTQVYLLRNLIKSHAPAQGLQHDSSSSFDSWGRLPITLCGKTPHRITICDIDGDGDNDIAIIVFSDFTGGTSLYLLENRIPGAHKGESARGTTRLR